MEIVLASEDDLDGPARDLRKHRGQRLREKDLAAEAAAQLRADHADLRLRHAQHVRNLVADEELALRRGPDRQLAAGCVVIGHGGVRLNVALMHHRRPPCALDDAIGFSETLVDVAPAELRL